MTFRTLKPIRWTCRPELDHRSSFAVFLQQQFPYVTGVPADADGEPSERLRRFRFD
jgi:hypothetical protein